MNTQKIVEQITLDNRYLEIIEDLRQLDDPTVNVVLKMYESADRNLVWAKPRSNLYQEWASNRRSIIIDVLIAIWRSKNE
jgi:hypothetical protein